MNRRLRTVSLRRRVTLLALGVLTVVLVLVGVLADVVFGAQSRAELVSRLDDRAQLAEQLARQGVVPAQIVRRVQLPSVRVRLVTAGGRVLGADTDLPEVAPPPDPASGPGPGPGPPGAPRAFGSIRALTRALPDGSTITLFADTTEVTAAQSRLRRVLLLVDLGAVGLAALVLLGTTRLALAPLDAMTNLARSIARGGRGARLAPERTDTELGRTAAAFDDMLDALEGSEARTRQFVADAAHELRTPITGVRAAAEAAVAADLSPAERDRLHLLLLREAGRAGRLVEDLLAMARIDAGLELRREPVELLGLAGLEADRARLLAPWVELAVSGSPVTVSADPGRIGQVLANLLDNARRHAGGRIGVRVGAAAGGAEVAVADDGPGVPPPDRERIFDRLVRLDDARSADGGAGLGLAIARGIARAHGGELSCVDPPAGVGALFVLSLPGRPAVAEGDPIVVPGPAQQQRDHSRRALGA